MYTGFERRRGRRRRAGEIRINEPAIYILDYMPLGYAFDRYPEYRNKPVVQAIGERYLTLLEAEPYEGVDFSPGEREVLDQFSRIKKIIGRIDYVDLSSAAKTVLPDVLRKIILNNEKVYIEFFNMAEPITIRLHSLELLPGIGKKTMKNILEERKKKPFESFRDLQERTKISDPVKMLVDRIIQEIQGGQKYYLFIKPYRRERGALYLGYLERIYRSRLPGARRTL